MRLAAFVIALLLLAGSVDPTRGWLIALAVLTGLGALRPRFGNILAVRPAVDLRLASFVLAVLLLAGTVDPTREWLVALSVVTGLAAFMPRILGIDAFGGGRGRWDVRDCAPFDWGERVDRREAREDRRRARWEDRMDRRLRRAGGWEDEWS